MTAADEGTPLVKSTPPRARDSTLLSYKFSNLLARCLPNYGLHASTKEAWSYFEHFILPRRMINEDGSFSRAPPGTEDSTLYPAWTTPQSDLKDFGTGIAVYFETLRALTAICLIAGLLYIPTIYYYGSDGYTSKHIDTLLTGSLRGSLICPEPVWVPCPDCTLEEWRESPHRIGHDVKGLTFALKNTCAPPHWLQGINHLVVMIVVSVAIFLLGFYQEKLERQYDESVLTASDFSIQVDNPPPDAVDPDEWKKFFEQFGEVASVTVALNNTELLKALTRRRVLMQKASYSIKDNPEEGIPLQRIPPMLESQNPRLHKKLVEIDAKCRELLDQVLPTSAVFVTFEKEHSQRVALKSLEVSQLIVELNMIDEVDPQHRFRGSLVLDVFEAPEPSEIRWQDLDETNYRKLAERLLTSVLTIGVIVASFWLVDKAYESDMDVAAITITLLNILMPHVFKRINSFESHQSESTYQASLYLKITVFRWVNTGIVTILVKPFTDTLADRAEGLIASVHAILRAEIIIAPVLHMLDIGGFVKRQILGPRAFNQAAMNSYFRGSTKSLGEMYTNLTKTIFLVFFYSAIFPAGFFYGAIALFLTYVTDKFLLLRGWGPMPEIGDEIAFLSRRVFFPLTLVVLAVTSEFFYSAYPCDNLCDTDSVLSNANGAGYIGNHTVSSAARQDVTATNATFSEGDPVYTFCNQDFLQRIKALLNFFSMDRDSWMSGDQEGITFAFGLFTVAILAAIALRKCHIGIERARALALGSSISERDSHKLYSEQEKIQTYVPQCPNPHFAFPLIGADLSTFEGSYVGWRDPVLDYEFYNLEKDVAALGYTGDAPVLSRVHQYFNK